MIRLHAEFATEAAAIAWRDGMYRAYAPEGYSTWIRIDERTRPSQLNGVLEIYWVAWGSRAESCD